MVDFHTGQLGLGVARPGAAPIHVKVGGAAATKRVACDVPCFWSPRRSITFRGTIEELGMPLIASMEGEALRGNQSFETAPFRGELMLFRRRFLDARRGGAERVGLVRAEATLVTTRPT